MKVLFFLLLPLTIFFSSCQKNEYAETAIPNRTIIVNLASGTWRTSDAGKSYVAGINMPEITNDFNERGGVLVYLSFGNQTYEQLPEVYKGVSYSYTTSPGRLEIELQSSDGTTVINPPTQTVTAKIVLLESQF